MDRFAKEFVTQMFLDTDNVSIMNRLVVAGANVVTEHTENVAAYNEALKEEFGHVLQTLGCEIEEPQKIPSQINGSYYENSVLKFDDEEYLTTFKMRKSTVQALIKCLKENIEVSSMFNMDKNVHIFLSLLTSDYSYSVVATLYGQRKATVSNIFYKMASLISELRYQFISWPSIEEQHVTRVKVNSRHGFPNCVGFIDAFKFKIGKKDKKKRKQEYILLQAVCDESLMFIDIHVGDIGKTKKSKVFRDSSLAQELKNFVDFENHILGDVEYKLRENLITPFSTEELLTSEEMKFNDSHWRARGYIGHAFELLRERFRKLRNLDIVSPNAITKVIYASCVLHNLVLLHEGSGQIKEELVTCDEGVTIDNILVKTAVEKRQFLCNYINFINPENNSTSPDSSLKE